MNFLATLRVALAALRVNKLRSALTMLGIIIGVAAVIAMVAVGAGAQARVEDQIKSLGSNLIIILSGNFTSGGARMGSGSQLTITEDDAYAIAARDPGVQAAAPHAARQRAGRLRQQQLVHADPRHHAGVPRGAPMGGRRAAARSTSRTSTRAAKVVLLGQTVARTLFGDADPVGETVRIRRVPLTVIGVLDRKGQSMIGQDQDDVVLMPITTARKRVLGGPTGQEPQRAARSPCACATAPTWPRPSRRCATCCASGTSCSRARRTISSCATCRKCWPRRRPRRRCSRCCSRRSPRCRWSSAASAS